MSQEPINQCLFEHQVTEKRDAEGITYKCVKCGFGYFVSHPRFYSDYEPFIQRVNDALSDSSVRRERTRKMTEIRGDNIQPIQPLTFHDLYPRVDEMMARIYKQLKIPEGELTIESTRNSEPNFWAQLVNAAREDPQPKEDDQQQAKPGCSVWAPRRRKPRRAAP